MVPQGSTGGEVYCSGLMGGSVSAPRVKSQASGGDYTPKSRGRSQRWHSSLDRSNGDHSSRVDGQLLRSLDGSSAATPKSPFVSNLGGTRRQVHSQPPASQPSFGTTSINSGGVIFPSHLVLRITWPQFDRLIRSSTT